jgi:light-regulated signal transduction histidine kinase (bacteriophytochrome)
VATRFKVGRQTAAYHLKRMVESQEIFKKGSTRGALYSIFPFQNASLSQPLEIKMVKNLKGLQEDRVFEEVEARLPLKKIISRNVHSIFSYAFMKMLNNAIDHSNSEKCLIQIRVREGVLFFSIEDRGVGVFHNLQKSFHLNDELEAAHHLFKGKQTTMPQTHLGQGIFFTSRIADQFQIGSHKLRARIDNDQDDFILLEARHHRGTQVEFSIRARSKKNLQKLFQDYANEDFEFDRNQVRVRLGGDELVSRSQARCFVVGLESFDRITFDFQKVKGIGQAFADEIFRVFQNRHSHIKIDVINANLAIQFMIARVL